MQKTIFDTPLVQPLFKYTSILVLKLLGWKREGSIEGTERCVVIAAPHTSNWDFFYTLLIAFAFRKKMYWMGKDKLFKKQFGSVVRWMGGIPVDRTKTSNLEEKTIQCFHDNKVFSIVIAPEGTRGRVVHWKTGFYRIAEGAGVPVLPAYLDYKTKRGGFGQLIFPTGDIEADMRKIRDFYSDKTGKNAHLFDHKSEIADYKKERIVS
jgi:1-acyl-sn-glycerol-3-phosphate acyltransferase